MFTAWSPHILGYLDIVGTRDAPYNVLATLENRKQTVRIMLTEQRMSRCIKPKLTMSMIM